MVWSSTKAGRAESHPLSARPFFIGRLKMVHAENIHVTGGDDDRDSREIACHAGPGIPVIHGKAHAHSQKQCADDPEHE